VGGLGQKTSAATARLRRATFKASTPLTSK
jgi:hypothetical protein